MADSLSRSGQWCIRSTRRRPSRSHRVFVEASSSRHLRLHLPDIDGLEVLRHNEKGGPETEVIVVTATARERALGSDQSRGVYFGKSLSTSTVYRPLAERALEAANFAPNQNDARPSRPARRNSLIARKRSDPLRDYRVGRQVDANVSCPRSGTGQDLIAMPVHYNSLRPRNRSSGHWPRFPRANRI